MKRILVTGRTGQVGRELVRLLTGMGQIEAPARQQLDLADPDSIRGAVRALSPHIIVNAAAYTAVDKAESEPDLAHRVNGIAPGVLAEEARRCGALLVHYSTDYVFDGARPEPYVEEDAPNPLNTYGRTKLEGERAIVAAGGAYLILRTSWIYSAQPPNFVLTMLKLGREKKELSIVNDQIGSPTWARALAAATTELLQDDERAKREPGIYHLSAQGYTTRFDFAQRIFQMAREIAPEATGSPVLRPITTAEYPLPAARPLNAATSKEKIKRVFGVTVSGWEDQLRNYLRELLKEASAANAS